MGKNNKSPWFIRILSLFFAILLYFNANSLTLGNNPDYQINELEAVAEKVPVNVTYNQEKYFISGYEETVNVTLKSANKILLDKESNAETRSFSVVMDLTKYTEGTQEVPLEVVGLPNSVKATIEPSKLSVTIDKRQSNSFKVEAAIDPNIYANGYETQEVKIDPSIVKLSGSANVLSQVDRVIAGISDKTNITGNFSQKVKPYAINKDGQLLNVLFEPDTVRMDVTVSVPSKRVKINPIQSGVIPRGIEDYTFTMTDDTVDLEGPAEMLDEITTIDLKIDTSNIRETMSSSYVIVVPKGVKATPETAFVTVIPNESKDATKTTTESKK